MNFSKKTFWKDIPYDTYTFVCVWVFFFDMINVQFFVKTYTEMFLTRSTNNWYIVENYWIVINSPRFIRKYNLLSLFRFVKIKRHFPLVGLIQNFFKIIIWLIGRLSNKTDDWENRCIIGSKFGWWW